MLPGDARLREQADADRIVRLLRALGAAARSRERRARVAGRRGLVDRDRLEAAFAEIEPQLFRFPAIDAAAFRRRVAEIARAEE
jgi:hypothetical protein